MQHVQGDLFSAPNYYVIAHGISADLKLGAGIARTIQQVYYVRQQIWPRNHSVGQSVSVQSKGRRQNHLQFGDERTFLSHTNIPKHCISFRKLER